MLKNWNPAVANTWMFLLAGAMWSAVGTMLCSLAYRWLAELHNSSALWIGLAGTAISLIVYRFGFLHIAQRNIRRLQAFVEKTCLFAFMPWKSYLLVAGMMALGMILRNSSLPHAYLAVIYITIGAALFLSSLHYYPHFWKSFSARPLADVSSPESGD